MQDHHATILRPRTFFARLGVSRSAGYSAIKDGLLPPPIKIGPRASGLPDFEVDAINRARIAGQNASEIRALVGRLVAARKAAA